MIPIVKNNCPWLVIICLVFSSAISFADEPFSSQEEFRKQAKQHFEKGRDFYANKRYENALLEFETAYRIYPESEMRLNIAYTLWGLGRLKEARREFRKFSRTTPDEKNRVAAIQALQTLGAELDREGMNPSARRYVKAALVFSGAAAVTALVSGGVAQNATALSLNQKSEKRFTALAGVAISTSVVAALSGATVIFVKRGSRTRPLQIFASPTQIGIGLNF